MLVFFQDLNSGVFVNNKTHKYKKVMPMRILNAGFVF